MNSASPEPVTLARQAMATRFEMVLHGNNPVALRAAGEEALTEIERLEGQLSLYRNTSEIAHLNARAAREAVRVSPALFRLLEQARRLNEETNGAFDITIAPLVRCWGFMGGTGQRPAPEAIEAARAKVGMHLVEMNAANFTVRFARDGVMLDLGAIGKGYAIDQAVDILREAGVTSAILHGGTSSVYAIGHPPDAEHWKVAIERPPENRTGVSSVQNAPASFDPSGSSPDISGSAAAQDRGGARPKLLAVVPLRDDALSVSAVWGKSFQSENKTFGHVIDPRSGQPAGCAVQAVVAFPSTTESDALSTALLTLGPSGLELLARIRPGSRCLVIAHDGTNLCPTARGISTI